MRNKETNQTTMESEDQEGKKPKIGRQSEREAIRRKVTDEVQDSLRVYNHRLQHDVLSELLKEVQKTTDKADELLAMEHEVRAVVGRFDLKTKAVIAMLQDIAAVDGLSLGVDFGYQLLYRELNDDCHVKRALKAFPNDADLACLSKAHRLAQELEEEHERDFRCLARKKPEVGSPQDELMERAVQKVLETVCGMVSQEYVDTVLERALNTLPADDEDGEETEDTEASGEVGLVFVRKWLDDCSFREKLAALLLGRLIMAEHTYDEPDKSIGNEYLAKWTEEIQRASMFDDVMEPQITGFVVAMLQTEY